jgi:hypothetical protein
MEKQTVIPQDILDDANRLYPEKVWMGSLGWVSPYGAERDAYIKGRMDERKEPKESIEKQAQEYANKITKNDTYREYLIDAYINGYKCR